ncbi:MAG TPA: aconitase family protein, partial [bacterium]
GKKIHPEVSLSINPGSKQVLEMISRNGALADIISAGARILESSCGPCIGMGQSPPTGSVSLRTFNRNFEGRSGTKDANVYIVSPETAAISALKGEITSPLKLGKPVKIFIPNKFSINDNMIIPPVKNGKKVEIIRGPNIKPLPDTKPLPDSVSGKVLIKVGDNISTDHILPAGAKVLPLRSNIPAISEYTFNAVDPQFVKRAKEWGAGVVLGGMNYGQGSSREHAAIAPMYLGVKAVITKSFARIHRANLINFGIVPLMLENENDYNLFDTGDDIQLDGLREAILNKKDITIRNATKDKTVSLKSDLTGREREILAAGGRLNYVKLGGSNGR